MQQAAQTSQSFGGLNDTTKAAAVFFFRFSHGFMCGGL